MLELDSYHPIKLKTKKSMPDPDLILPYMSKFQISFETIGGLANCLRAFEKSQDKVLQRSAFVRPLIPSLSPCSSPNEVYQLLVPQYLWLLPSIS